MSIVSRALRLQLNRSIVNILQSVSSREYSSENALDHIVSSPVRDIEIPNLNLHEYIWSNVHKWSDKIAVECVETGRKYTYDQCIVHSNAVMNFLRKIGLRKGDVIGIVLPNVPEFIMVVMGSAQAGLTISPINPSYTSEEVKRQLIDSNAKLVFTLTDLWTTVQQAVQSIPGANIPIVAIRQQQTESFPAGAVKFDEIIANPATDAKWEISDVNNDLLLPYSSGTTGLPKGVQLSHYNVVANHIQSQSKEVQFIQDTTDSYQDVIPVLLPMYHMYGLGVIALPLLAKGVKLVTIPKFGSKVFLKTLVEHKPNLLYLVPPVVLMFLNNPDFHQDHIASVRSVLCGAAPLGAADIYRFQDKCRGRVDLLQLYGLSETSPITHMQTMHLPNCVKIGGSGIPVANTQCKIVRPDDETADPRGLAANESGELLIRGPQIMKGYHKNPEATKKTISENGWLRTGDIAHYDEDGQFFITDRLKELIKVSGLQVAPAELEEILRDHPGVDDAAVIGVPDEKHGEVPRAFIVLGKTRERFTAEDIQAFVAAKVAKHKRLAGGVQILDAIPKNPSGKILRRELKKLL